MQLSRLKQEDMARLKKPALAAAAHKIEEVFHIRAVEKTGTRSSFAENIINSSVDGIFTYDTALRYTFWNPTMESLTGFLKEEILGRHISEIFPAVKQNGELAKYQEVLKGRSIILNDSPFIHPATNEHRFAETYFSPIRNQNQKIIGGLGVMRDITDYKAINEAGVIAEQKLRSLIDAATDLIATVSPDGAFITLNHAWEELTGWPREAGLQIKFINLLHAEDRAAFLHWFQVLLRGEEVKAIESRIRRKDGGYRIIETTARSLSQGGRIVGALCVSRDITDRKANEEMLRTWAHIFKNVNVGIKIDDAEGRTVQMVNPGYAAMHGYTQEELMNIPATTQYAKEAQHELAYHNELLKKSGYHVFESIHVRKDGSAFPVQIEATIVKDEHGQAQYRALLVRDITSRHELERKLRDYTKDLEVKIAERTSELSRKLEQEVQDKAEDEALLSSIGEGVIVTNEKGRIIFINHQTEEMLGWENSVAVGQSLFPLLVMQDKNHRQLPSERRPIHSALQNGKKVTSSDYYFVRNDGVEFPVVLTTSPVILGGKIIGAMTVFRDITKEKEVDRVKSEFVSLASHQLRTPLSTINWYAESLLAGKVSKVDKRQRKYLENIYGASRRMVKLIHDLLNVSRLELGTFGLNPERIKVSEFMREVVKEMELTIKVNKLEIIERYDPKVPVISIDRQLAHSVFHNLLTNAIKYSNEGGTITLEIVYWNRGKIPWAPPESPAGPLILCAITDNGCGIPKAAQHKIFTKFFRADNVKEKDQDGTGLGLYIVKSLVTLLKGVVWFESPGSTLAGDKTGKQRKGTTFYVAIPVPARKFFN